ncbi:MAG: hypothetical protein WDW36_001434 [Sanguina aurantia]
MPTAETFNAQLSSMNPESFTRSGSFGPASLVQSIFATKIGAFEHVPTLEDYLEQEKPRMYGDSRMKTALGELSDGKMCPLDAVIIDTYVQPIDRGPVPGADLLHSWQYQMTGKATAAQVLLDIKADLIESGGLLGMHGVAGKFISQNQLDDTFFIIDLGNVMRMLQAWRAAMPRVTPFYAVKCYPDVGMLRLMAAMDMGFDCASAGEVETVLSLGVHPSRIIFAHPCKRPCDIRYAREHGVEYTTFDTESELHKMAAMNPGFKCVLRIRADDPDARVQLGLKYGAEVEEADDLLRTARELGLNVVGVSFHVGSACKNMTAFTSAIEKARVIFDKAALLGFDMELLDIGGGFTGNFDAAGNVIFGDIATTLNSAIAASFPEEMNVRVIAEPGRYFAETSSTLMTPIYGQRVRTDAVTKALSKDYWITDGLYGSMNCMLYDGQNPEYSVMRSPLLPACGPELSVMETSTIWGPTCDSADVVYKDVQLPQIRNGDWLLWPNAGAYTLAGACDFNGINFTCPNKYYVFSESAVDAITSSAVETMAA